MPNYLSANALPATNGQALGAPDKRWKIYATDVDLSGAMSGAGLASWIVQNSTPDANSVDVSSDSGFGGGLLSRFVIDNVSGNNRTNAWLKNLDVNFGKVGEGGKATAKFHSENTDAGDVLQVIQKGDGARVNFALSVDGVGTWRSNGPAGQFMCRVCWQDDLQPRWQIKDDGGAYVGPGGNTAPDWGYERTGPSIGRIHNGAGGPGDLRVRVLYLDLPDGGAPPMVVTSKTRVVNLNADLLDGYDWNSPPALGAVAPGIVHATTIDTQGQITAGAPNGTPPFVVPSSTKVDNLTVGRTQDCVHDGTINPNGQAIKHMRVNIPSLASGARTTVRITWPTAFLSGNYTCGFYIFDFLNPGTAGLIAERALAQEVDHVDIQVLNQGAEARTGSLHVIAMRDS